MEILLRVRPLANGANRLLICAPKSEFGGGDVKMGGGDTFLFFPTR